MGTFVQATLQLLPLEVEMKIVSGLLAPLQATMAVPEAATQPMDEFPVPLACVHCANAGWFNAIKNRAYNAVLAALRIKMDGVVQREFMTVT
jgi:hypothetical protein